MQGPKQKPKAKSQTHVSNAVKIDAVDPIPFEYDGEAFSYVQGQRYIPFLNPGDNFAKTLLEAKTLSVTHTACIETKKTFCAGRGLYDTNGKDFDKKLKTWLKRMNVKGESQRQINRKAFGSFFTFGNIPIEIVRCTVMGKKKLFVYVHNLLEWRLENPDKNGNINRAIQSKLFLRRGVIGTDALKDAKVLPLYNPDQPDKKNWVKDVNGTERTMIWIKNDMDGYPNYGMPSSVASLLYQVLEYKYGRFNLDTLDNNMVIGGILALKGNLGQDEANRIGKKIIATHTGDGKRGRVAVVASEEGIEKSEFHQYNNQTDGSFKESDDKVMAKIILANEWSALLAGLSHENSLGKGNTFFKKEYDTKKATVIDPMQEFLITNLWEPLMKIASEWMGVQWDQYELGIQDIDPISAIADVDPAAAVKVNELRTVLNLPEDTSPKGDLYLAELKPSKPDPGKPDPNKGGDDVPA